MRWADLSSESRTLGGVLRQQADRVGDDLFLMDPTGRWTYAEVNERVNRLAHGLRDIEVQPGDRVLLWLPNSAEMAVVALALSKLGAVWIPLNTALKGDWLTSIIQRARATLMIADLDLLDLGADADLAGLTTIVVAGEASDWARAGVRTVPLEQLLVDKTEEPGPPRDYREVASVMWTSGTTGTPKGVMQTHSSWLIGAAGLASFRDFRDGDVLYSCLPMFNSGGWSLNVIGAMVAGLAIGIDPSFTASRFWDRCRYYGATQVVTLGSMYDFILKVEPSPRDRDHDVRIAANTPIPSARAAEFMERFGIQGMWQGYAQSELMLMCGATPDQQIKADSCGIAADDVEIAILDDEDRRVSVGQVGEICARPRNPYMMFAGYFDDPELTARALRNLWYHTGDMGYIDADGELFFADRRSDLMRFGGRTVSASEVERAASAHVGVADAAAFGVAADALASETEIMLTVALKPGADLTPEALALFINQTAPHYLVPRFIDIVEALPRTPTGKVEKRTLKGRGVGAETWDRAVAGFVIDKGRRRQ